MDHSSLIPPFRRLNLILGLGVLLNGCVTQKAQPKTQPPRTVLTSSASPETLLYLSEQFLEWQKGYTVRVRDRARGLTVTDWAQDSPFERHRITLRTTFDVSGSLLSSHIETQVFEDQEWIDVPSDGQREASLLSELQSFMGPNPVTKAEKK